MHRSFDSKEQKSPPCSGGLVSGLKVQSLLHWVPIRVYLVDLAQVQLADACFNLVHVADHYPHQMVGRMNFLAISFADCRRKRHRLLGKGIEVVFRQAVLQYLAIGPGELLHGFKASGQAERGIVLLVF